MSYCNTKGYCLKCQPSKTIVVVDTHGCNYIYNKGNIFSKKCIYTNKNKKTKTQSLEFIYQNWCLKGEWEYIKCQINVSSY